ncbi:type II toxin-antitoxin system HicB family antitoxin [Synechocystis sp. PCC 7339]|uniref:type II toxin-antitoxin system HicB family antitoxin n=1 Tax=unclassified Synechocystis TaxID=2640012 RepID=UPI001BAF17CC|nr:MULTISPECIES: type II toxin-antitoxin system HicB family antitoxin [unclassified Synechocystis]QUS59963.1 type II toxin-antitoxin system HicB family antitoxin [Synechocystis sp. PCC 7338]UAJ72581.1 type II toxin-antitoxin system HicB family antitoxin [Synechocystis sp. PCC 7339]
MNVKAIIHEAEEGGYWAEVPIFSGCYTQGETIEEVMENLKEVISLYVDDQPEKLSQSDRIVELTL